MLKFYSSILTFLFIYTFNLIFKYNFRTFKTFMWDRVKRNVKSTEIMFADGTSRAYIWNLPLHSWRFSPYLMHSEMPSAVWWKTKKDIKRIEDINYEVIGIFHYIPWLLRYIMMWLKIKSIFLVWKNVCFQIINESINDAVSSSSNSFYFWAN